MSQKITFGLHLDGERGFRPRSSLGESVVGPLGMLNALETQLGLGGRAFSRAERLIQMRQTLLSAANGRRFYEKSFDIDPLGTGSTLLSWRDEWYESGWDGGHFAVGTTRLEDMEEVERHAAAVPPGVGQRLMAIERALQEASPAIDVTLATPLNDLPQRWRKVMERLRATECGPIHANGKEGTTLRALQEALIRKRTGGVKVPWRDDGSLAIVRSETEVSVAEWLASRLGGMDSDSLLVVGQGEALLDAAFRAFDRPVLGTAPASVFRAPLQLMQLALRLVWAPIDYEALLQFLTHTVGPIPPYARRMLAEHVASTPGVGGESWKLLLKEIESKSQFDTEKLMADIAFWLQGERWDAAEGAPVDQIHDRVDRIADLCRAHLNGGDETQEAAWAAAFAQAAALRDAVRELKRQGAERINRDFLDRLVWDVAGSGAGNPLFDANAGAFAHASDPAAVLEPFDQVVWWQMAATPLPRPYPWSVTEIRALRESGVALPDISEKLAAQARSWLRPILAAREQLLLMLPKAGVEMHPMWLQVQECLKPESGGDTVEASLTSKVKSSRPIQHRRLPALRRWWQIEPKKDLLADQHTSYTALSKLLFDPYEWVLKYAAKLSESRLLEAPGDALYGNLSHASIERLYRNEKAMRWNREAVHKWFDGDFDALIVEEGAALLMPGKRAELESFRSRLRESVACLHEHLRTAKVVSVEAEHAFDADTALGALHGRTDLLVTRSDGRQGVIDMKWGSATRFREAVAAGTHLQLAVYGKLVEQASGRWPAAAYYMVRTCELIPASEGFFDVPVAGKCDALAEVWERAVVTWKWRRSQLKKGRIEVVFDSAEPGDASIPPEDAFAMPKPYHGYDPFIHLAGWDPSQ